MRRLVSWLLWQRVPIRDITVHRPRREARWWLAFAVAYVALAVCVGLAIRAFPLPLLGSDKFTDDLWYVLGFKLVALLGLPIVVLKLRGYRLRDLLPGWSFRPRTVLTILIVAALGGVLNLGHLGPIGEAVRGGGAATLGLLALGAFLPLFTAALPEELVYRGILQTRLEAVSGRAVAILATAVLFTAWHVPTRFLLASGVEGQAGDLGSVLLGTALPVFIVGLIFGWGWDRWRSLPHLIVAHWAIDLLPSVSSFLGIDY